MPNDYKNRQRTQYDAEQVLIAQADATGDEVGSGIDVGENVELDIVSTYRGALGNADNTAAVAIEESDDNVSFSALGSVGSLSDAVAANFPSEPTVSDDKEVPPPPTL